MKLTTADVLTLATGRLCVSVNRMYEIFNAVTQDNLFTHQLPRAFKAVSPYVKNLLPWVNGVDESECTKETWQDWLKSIEGKVGNEHEVVPMPPGSWTQRNPLEEAQEMFGEDRVITVTPSTPQPINN